MVIKIKMYKKEGEYYTCILENGEGCVKIHKSEVIQYKESLYWVCIENLVA